MQILVGQLELDSSLRRPDRVRERTDALDRLEMLLMTCEPRDRALDRRAETLRARLEADNAALHASIRNEIGRGAGAQCLREWLARRSGDDAIECVPGESYDYLDELVSGVLQLAPPAAARIELTSEMVRYQPTPARHIFDLIARGDLGADDVLIDLGSGLGHVPLLVSICTGARAIGVELEPSYVECARRCAEALRLDRVTFVREDARSADFSIGTLFYLYTPFHGSVLRSVLDSLREQAAVRKIRVCAFGPCVPAIAEEAWLDVVGTAEKGRLSIFRSR